MNAVTDENDETNKRMRYDVYMSTQWKGKNGNYLIVYKYIH